MSHGQIRGSKVVFESRTGIPEALILRWSRSCVTRKPPQIGELDSELHAYLGDVHERKVYERPEHLKDLALFHACGTVSGAAQSMGGVKTDRMS